MRIEKRPKESRIEGINDASYHCATYKDIDEPYQLLWLNFSNQHLHHNKATRKAMLISVVDVDFGVFMTGYIEAGIALRRDAVIVLWLRETREFTLFKRDDKKFSKVLNSFGL